MDWNDVKVLIEVVRSGSFIGAAGALGISQPSVTRRIARMEDVSGVRLFRRSTVGVEMTGAGRELYQRATAVEERMREFENSLKMVVRRRRVLVKATEGVSNYLLTPLVTGQPIGPLGGVARRLGIELPPMQFMPPHAQERADIRIVWTAPEHLPVGSATDHVKRLASIRFVPFVSDAYLVRKRPPLNRFEDVARHALVTLSDYTWFHTGEALGMWNELVDEAGDRAIHTGWSLSVAQLTAGGGGISLLPTYAPMLVEQLQLLEVSAPPMVVNLWILAGEDELKDPPVRQCYDAIASAFATFNW